MSNIKVEVVRDVSLVALTGSIVEVTKEQYALLGDKVKEVKPKKAKE